MRPDVMNADYSMVVTYVTAPWTGGVLAGLFHRWHVTAIHRIKNPSPDYPYWLDGVAQDLPRLNGDQGLEQKIIHDCHEEAEERAR